MHTKPRSKYAQRKARSRNNAERRNNQILRREARRNQESNQAGTNSEETGDPGRLNSEGNDGNANPRKGKNIVKGKWRGKARRHGLTALSYGRSWSLEATEEYNRQVELDRYFR